MLIKYKKYDMFALKQYGENYALAVSVPEIMDNPS
jgi:hypothetical protein